MKKAKFKNVFGASLSTHFIRWSYGKAFDATFGPLLEGPTEAIRERSRSVARKLHLKKGEHS